MTMNQSLSYRQIDRSIRGILKDFEQENTLLPETFADHVQRLVRVYPAIKPLLTMLTLLPFPPVWRKGLDLLKQVIEAVAAASPNDIPANFKAGKDL